MAHKFKTDALRYAYWRLEYDISNQYIRDV